MAPAAPAALFAALADLHPILVQVLYNRGFASAAQIQAFLSGDGAGPHDPRLLYGMDRAIGRMRDAIRRGETIAAHGDFDVDGVTATAILVEGLRAAGAQVKPFLPQRTATGYGPQPASIDRLAGEGVSLVVTGDTGTRATEAVRRAAELGVDVIVTDHHLPGEEAPAAVALINPQQGQCSYPFKDLSGAGVAWKLVHALELEGLLGHLAAADLLDLVALGTIVDVSPLRGENRTLVQRGLTRLRDAPRPGIQALLGRPGTPPRRLDVDERTVAFSIGPRLNAAGRMDDAGLALELLMTGDPARAAAIVGELEVKNAERQRLTEVVLAAARQQAERATAQPALIVRGEGWPAGVLGLVAARLAEEYRRPAFVVDVRPDGCRGSGRSVEGFDLVQTLTECADLLVEFGGHTLAAGFAVLPDQLDALAERLASAAAQQPPVYDAPIVADYALAETDLDWALYNALAGLRPFGAGNPPPLFFTPGLRLLEARPVGAGGKHLRLRARFGKQVIHGFGPEMGAQARELALRGAIDALYSLEVSTWNGYETLELRMHGARPAAETVYS